MAETTEYTHQLRRLTTIEGHEDRVWHCAWSPSGNELATCSADRSTKLWARDGWAERQVLEDVHDRTVRAVAWSPTGHNLATASFDATVAVWQKEDGEFGCVSQLEGHENEVKCVAWDKSGLLIATCSRDKSVWVWEAMEDDEFECVAVLHGHTQDVKMVAWHPQHSFLVSASYDDTIRVWNEQDEEWGPACTLTGHTSTVWSIAFDKMGEYMVSVGDDCALFLWRLTSEQGNFELVSQLQGAHPRVVYYVDWCPLTGLIATAAGDDAIRLFKLELEDEGGAKLVLAHTVEDAHSSDVNCVRWNPTVEGMLASVGDDNKISVWQLS